MLWKPWFYWIFWELTNNLQPYLYLWKTGSNSWNNNVKAWEKSHVLLLYEKMNLKCILLCYVWWQRSRQFTKMYSLKSRSITLVFEKGRINFIKEFFWETFLCNSYIFCFVCKLSIQWWINIFFEYGIYLSRWFRNDRTYIFT